MKKWTVFVSAALCAALLCACAAQPQTAWETVDDELLLECASWQDGARQISFDVPDGAVAQSYAEDGARQIYAAKDGAYEIVSEVLLETSVQSLVRSVTGFDPERVQLIQTSRGDLTEYQFAWYSGSDEGGRLYRADAVLDEPYCYVLLFSTSEQSGTSYDSIAEAVFASMRLTDGGEV